MVVTEGVFKPNAKLEAVLLDTGIEDGKEEVDESRAIVAARESEMTW